MADPVILDLPADTWTVVATNKTSGLIHVKQSQSNVKFWQTYRATGGTAPTDLSDAILMNTPKEEISASTGIDVYVYPEGGTAKLRVDL
jgi:hypothetical protein